MSNFNRRHFIKVAASVTAVGIAGCTTLPKLKAEKRVVVIGGGAGGATAAKYIRKNDPTIEVTLIEAHKYHYTCFMSNEVIGGERSIQSIKFSYDKLAGYGINIVHDLAIEIEPISKKVTTRNGDVFYYDRLVVAPGIDFKWNEVEGYDPQIASIKIPHAWKAGSQTILLRKQLEAMQDGGTVIISVPRRPFRCHPGPYERASLIAHYLKTHKPASKVLILEPSKTFAQQKLFVQAWKRLYGFGTKNSLIDWLPAAEGGKVSELDAKNMIIHSTSGEQHKADVINLIPPQQAGNIAVVSDLVNGSGWCPVHHQTFESMRYKDIHVIGDASIAKPMPKSGYSANSQAKVCAIAIVRALQGKEMLTPNFLNACYAVLGKDYAISVAAVYKLENNKITFKGAGGLSPMDASVEVRRRELLYAHSWYNNITQDIFE